MDTIESSEIDDFCDIIETVLEYGFIEAIELCTLLDVDEAELDNLMSSSEYLSNKLWTSYNKSLMKYLKKIRKSYDRLYYSGTAR